MQIVTKMKVIMSPPGRILKEHARAPRAPLQPAQLKPDKSSSSSEPQLVEEEAWIMSPR